jgi:hypothetical protein
VDLEGAGRPRERAATADEVAEHIDPTTRLRPQLGAGAVFMGAPVAVEAELIGAKGTPLGGHPSGHVLHQRQVGARDVTGSAAIRLRYQDHFGAQRSHHQIPLGRVPRRHHGHERVPLHCAHDGQARACVPARELDDRLTSGERAARFGVLDHA